MFFSPHSLSLAAGYGLLWNALQARSVDATPTISAHGAKFFFENGTQYYIKGVAYQLTPNDPLIDTAQCQRDIAAMTPLGTNAIRVYHVDPTADHSGCMNAFANAGIYLFVDLDTFDTAIQQDNPYWNETQFKAFQAVLDEFQKYDNTAGVFVGNEVLDTAAGSPAAPYVLAAGRDIKAYRDKKGYRKIPVGYSAADIAALRPMLQNYMACMPNASDRLDFFGLNSYEWCGDSSYMVSGYDMLEKNATGYNIPLFFSETGCNSPEPRLFTDQSAIFGPHMDNTWSGAIIYEWVEAANNYGLISYGPPNTNAPATDTNVVGGYTVKGTPTPIKPDYTNLQSQWATLSPTGVALSNYVTSTITPPACPSSTSGGWAVDPSSPLPTLGQSYNAAATNAGSVQGSHSTSAGATASSTSSKSHGSHGAKNGASTLVGAGSDNMIRVSVLLCSLVGAVAWWL